MNTLFARTVLLSVVILLAVHVGYRLIAAISLTDEGPHMSAPIAAVDDTSPADIDNDATTLRLAVSIRPHIAALGAPVMPSLRAAVWLPEPERTVSTDALMLDDTAQPDMWNATPDSELFRFAPLAFSLPAALLVLCAYGFRQTRRSLRDLARLTRHAGACTALPSAPSKSLCDVQRLARTLSDLLCRHHQALDDQSSALAAFSRQLDARVARLRSRALNVAQWHKRVAFIEDIELFSNVARQFVDVAGRSGASDTQVGVDAWLRDRFYHGASMDDAKIVLRLGAGRDFTLPHNSLERLVGNLVGNALAHGAAPIEICTTRGVRGWMLSVRDHGDGIDEASLAAASTPPVTRLPVHGSSMTLDEHDSHWGLGLSIVSRLARDCGAKLKLGNHPEGGFWARVIVPASNSASPATVSHAPAEQAAFH